MIGKYIAGSFQRKLPSALLEKWKFHTEYHNLPKEEVFTGDKSRKGGDGSRGGPKRREFTEEERESFLSLMGALERRQSKI